MILFLVTTQLFYIACIVAWLIVWMMSFMLFDSGIYFWNTFLFIVISLFPVVVVGSALVAWILRSRKQKTAVIINLLPTLWIISFGILLLL